MSRFILAIALAATAPLAFAAERAISIPTDSKADYTILQIGVTWPNRTITTKRVGLSGTSYSKRLYNCSNNTVKYLGSGDTAADMERSKAAPRMGPIVDQSIADYVGRYACKR